MTVDPKTLKSLTIGDDGAGLADNWKAALLFQNGNLNVKALLNNIAAKKKIPEQFFNAVKARQPQVSWPELQAENTPDAIIPLPVSRRKTRRNPFARRRPPKAPGRTGRETGSGLGAFGGRGNRSGAPTESTNPSDDDENPSDDDSVNNDNLEGGTHTNVIPVTEQQENESNQPSKRKITWFTHEWAGDRDEYNERESNGTLKALKTYTGPMEEDGFLLTNESAIPESLYTDEVIEHWNAIHEVNGKVYYDAETQALGELEPAEYFLVPTNWELKICPVEHIGAGLNVFQCSMLEISAVYSLAKEQAASLGFSEEDRIKWATLRMEAYKAGWFNLQKYTKFKPAPYGSARTFNTDLPKVKAIIKNAYKLCAFIPYMAEFHFRAYGSSYSRAGAADYVAKAQSFAQSMNATEILTYMDQDNLYGRALSWIGVKRPMEALRNPVSYARIPNPFKIRSTACPAGQALICTSVAVITSVKAAGWWDKICKAANYDDAKLVEVAGTIEKNPWKFHMLCSAYGETEPTSVEKASIEAAKEKAISFCPVLQAFLDSILRNTRLAQVKALRKYAEANMGVYHFALRFFRRINTVKPDDFEQVFSGSLTTPRIGN